MLPILGSGASGEAEVAVITSVGSPKVVIKSDQEPAMVDIQNQVRREIWNEIAEIKQKAQQISLAGRRARGAISATEGRSGNLMSEEGWSEV